MTKFKQGDRVVLLMNVRNCHREYVCGEEFVVISQTKVSLYVTSKEDGSRLIHLPRDFKLKDESFEYGDLVECTSNFGANRVGDTFVFTGINLGAATGSITEYAALAFEDTPEFHSRNHPINKLKKVGGNMFDDEVKVKTGNFIIGSIDKFSKAVSFSRTPKQHSTEVSAKAEAARLAKTNRNKKFVVVEIKAIASVDDVVWE